MSRLQVTSVGLTRHTLGVVGQDDVDGINQRRRCAFTRRMIGDDQSLGGSGQRQIGVIPLHHTLGEYVLRQLDATLLQAVAFLLRQDAIAHGIGGEHALVGAQHEHRTGCAVTDTIGTAHRHRVQALRDGTHIDGAAEHGEQLLQLGGRQSLLAQRQGEAIQNQHHLIPQTLGMGRQHRLGHLFQNFNLRLDTGGQAFLAAQPSVHRHGELAARHLAAQSGAQSHQRLHQRRAAGIEPCQGGAGIIVLFTVDAGRILGPFLLPAVTLDAPGIDVILDFSNVGGGQRPQVGLHQAQQLLGAPTAHRQAQRRPQIHHQRLAENVLTGVHIARDALTMEHLIQNALIIGEIAHHHRDVTATVVLLAEQTANLPHRIGALLVHVGAGGHRHIGGIPLVHHRRRSIQTPLQGLQSTAVGATVLGETNQLPCTTVTRNTAQLVDGGGDGRKQRKLTAAICGTTLVPLSAGGVGTQRDSNPARTRNKGLQHLQLLLGEALKAIHKHNGVVR